MLPCSWGSISLIQNKKKTLSKTGGHHQTADGPSIWRRTLLRSSVVNDVTRVRIYTSTRCPTSKPPSRERINAVEMELPAVTSLQALCRIVWTGGRNGASPCNKIQFIKQTTWGSFRTLTFDTLPPVVNWRHSGRTQLMSEREKRAETYLWSEMRSMDKEEIYHVGQKYNSC